MPSRRRRDEEGDESPAPTAGPATQRRRTEHDVSDDDLVEENNGAATQADGLGDMVKKMIRLALACEYQRRPIRRLDINEKVLGPNTRQFKSVWAQAQAKLNSVFGMEMVELPVKDKVTLQQRRAAQKTPTQSKPITSWMLATILPSEFRNPAILQPPAAPTASEESKYTAIYTLLVSLISLSGGSLPDAKMDRCLRRLQLEDHTPLAEYDRTEKLMKRMEKDGYIVRVKDSAGTGEDDVYWVVGPRGKVEVGEDGVRGLTKTVFGAMDTEADEDELERKIARSLGMNRQSEATTPGEPKRRGRGRRSDEDQQRNAGTNDDDDNSDDVDA